jgi:hypothetical protein
LAEATRPSGFQVRGPTTSDGHRVRCVSSRTPFAARATKPPLLVSQIIAAEVLKNRVPDLPIRSTTFATKSAKNGCEQLQQCDSYGSPAERPLYLQERRKSGHRGRSEKCRYCCKSRFALVIKNSAGRRFGFRVRMRGASSLHAKRIGDFGNATEGIRISD